VARLLGVQANELIESLTTCKVSARGDVISKSNSVSESRQSVNSLAMGLYSRLFDYIVSCVNKLLSFSRMVYGESSTIGILDIFGFECLENKNSFEQVIASFQN
jgi:myosin protein heavy chain